MNYPIIDCHCHIYPDKIAAKAAAATGKFYGINMYFNNTIGMFVTYKDIGRVYGGFTHVLASQKSYRNYKNTFEVNYSKNVFYRSKKMIFP